MTDIKCKIIANNPTAETQRIKDAFLALPIEMRDNYFGVAIRKRLLNDEQLKKLDLLKTANLDETARKIGAAVDFELDDAPPIIKQIVVRLIILDNLTILSQKKKPTYGDVRHCWQQVTQLINWGTLKSAYLENANPLNNPKQRDKLDALLDKIFNDPKKIDTKTIEKKKVKFLIPAIRSVVEYSSLEDMLSPQNPVIQLISDVIPGKPDFSKLDPRPLRIGPSQYAYKSYREFQYDEATKQAQWVEVKDTIGRSSCTYISCQMASHFLTNGIPDNKLLTEIIENGIRLGYQIKKNSPNTKVEHAEAGEVIQSPQFTSGTAPLRILQSIQGSTGDLFARLDKLYQEDTCLIITKNPETICVYFPKDSNGDVYLFDSHDKTRDVEGQPYSAILHLESVGKLTTKLKEWYPVIGEWVFDYVEINQVEIPKIPKK